MNQNTTLLNPTFQVTEQAETGNHSVIHIEPLEQGYGHTLGNSLRRVLLSSLAGAAITKVRITGAEHLYSTVEGVTEDVLQMTLNLKQIRVKSASDQPVKMTLKVQGPAEVTAADITAEAGVEVINTDQYIATVAKGKTLEIEMVVETGFGYIVADEKQNSAVGEIAVDALYSPVERVSYKVEATRVGRRTDYDRLILDVYTDGTITPLAAVQEAARILTRQFKQVVEPVVTEEKAPEPSLSPEEQEVLRLTVEELDLPTRIANALRKGGFKTVGDLVGAPSALIAKVKNLGEKSVVVIDEAMQKKGVRLGE